MKEEYNIWKIQKTMREKIKNILIILFLYIFNFIFYYLLFIIALYKINKKILNLIFINFEYNII